MFDPKKFIFLRHQSGKKNRQIAKEIKISIPSIDRWAAGKSAPRPTKYALLAKALNCAIGDFDGDYAEQNHLAPTRKSPEASAAAPLNLADLQLRTITALWAKLSEAHRTDLAARANNAYNADTGPGDLAADGFIFNSKTKSA
jgi:transcriptional regulator with XRE-family HTH domain